MAQVFKRPLTRSVTCLLLLLPSVAGFYLCLYCSYAVKDVGVKEMKDQGVVITRIATEHENSKDSREVSTERTRKAGSRGEQQALGQRGRAPASPVNPGGVASPAGTGTRTSAGADRDATRELAGRRAPLDLDAVFGAPSLDELFLRLVIVTAFSENHRLEAMSMIGTAHTSMPSTRIVIYDLGIDPRHLPTVTSLCNVEVRPFPFSKYPAYVSNLLTYAWKVIIIKETLDEFGAIFWADTSARFAGSLRTLIPLAQRHHGYLAIIHGYQPLAKTRVPHNYHFTLPGTFDRLGVNRTEYARSSLAPHPTANRQLILNSSTVQRRLIRPLYACALDETCISPPEAKRGNHQFDASALMLVLYKYMPGEFTPENDRSWKFRRVVNVYRYWDDLHIPQYCAD